MKNNEYKLLFAGSMGAGKTSAIAALSEIPLVSTDVINSDLDRNNKATTTVALDYGEVSLRGGDKLRLYGTPGQDRFDFMWGIVSKGAIGLILLIDSRNHDAINEMMFYLDKFSDLMESMALVVGVTQLDLSHTKSLVAYRKALAARGIMVPCLPIDARKREHIFFLIESILSQVEAKELVSLTKAAP